MKPLRRGWRRLLGSVAKGRSEQEMADELASHIEMQIEDNLQAGMSPREAERAARLKFGGVESAKESYRDQRGLPWIEALFGDLRYAMRGFRKNPVFALTAVAALALGIGATTAIFSLANSVVLKALPVPDPDRFVVLMTNWVDDSGESGQNESASPAKFMHWRAQSSVLQDVSAFQGGAMNYTGGAVVEQWHSMQVTMDTFRCFGMPILQGRSFTQEEDLPNGPKVVVISQGLWKRRFANDPQVLSKTILLSGEPYTVIGIVGDSPGLMEIGRPASDVFVPFQFDPNTSDQGNIFTVVARLKPGVTLAQAKERMRAAAKEFAVKYPDPNSDKGSFTVVPLREAIVSDIAALLLILGGAVSLVLLIACANVANLLLARAASRKREIGIRVAIGAGRGRVIRQLLTESVLLSVTGGALGLLLGDVGIRALLAANETELPTFAPVGIDWRVIGFALAVSLATGMVFGLFPALEGSRVDLNSILKDNSGRAVTGSRQNRVRSALVVSEVSLAVILLVGSALLIRTFVAVYKVDQGFETKNVITMQTSLTGPKYSKAAGVAETARDSFKRIQALPGVVSVSAASYLPLEGNLGLGFDIIGRPPGKDAHTGQGGWTPVSPGYFETFKIPVKRGRPFTDRDDAKSPPVVVINEAMAKQFWKDGDPLNDRIVIGRNVGKDFNDDPVRQIVGIVGNTRHDALEKVPGPRMYLPSAQVTDRTNAWLVRLTPMAWIVRTRTEPHALAPAIQEQLRQVTGLPISEVRSMEEVVKISAGPQRFNMLLMTVFGCSALVLAAIGIYGLMAYSVEQRKQEIGIRLALGAEAEQVKRMVVRQGMRLALIGVTLGLAAAWGLARLMESLLFQVKPRDPMVFVAVPVALSVVALLAVWFPAKRASRVDPAISLRYE